MFPAGNLRLGNNGALTYTGTTVSTGALSLTNAVIASGTAIPAGVPTGTVAVIAAYWDDLDVLGPNGYAPAPYVVGPSFTYTIP